MISYFPDARDLNREPFEAFKPLFARLEAPRREALEGRYEAAFTGPGWLRLGTRLPLALSGMSGWWGMEIDEEGGCDLVQREGRIEHKLCFEIRYADSEVDARPAVVFVYPEDSPFPWRKISAEVRQIEEGRLLGMILIDVAGLRGIALPFLLVRR